MALPSGSFGKRWTQSYHSGIFSNRLHLIMAAQATGVIAFGTRGGFPQRPSFALCVDLFDLSSAEIDPAQILSAKLYEVPEVFSRFVWHASLIQVWERDLRSSSIVEEDEVQLFRNVLERNGGRGIFTRLRTIVCPALSMNLVEAILSHSASTLTSLTISLVSRVQLTTPDSVIKTLDVLHRLSPNLTSITMNVLLDDALTGSLLQFPHLKILKQARISSVDVFSNLANKPGLTCLGLQCADLIPQSAEIVQLPQAIRNLDLVELSLSGPCATVIPLFKRFHIPSLRHASFMFKDESTSRQAVWAITEVEYTSCMNSLVNAAPALEDVSIAVEGSSNLPLGVLFAPFLPLRNMRRFVYSNKRKFAQRRVVQHTGTDEDFATIGRAWSALEVLRLEPATGFWKNDGPAPSAMALVHLQASCRRLTELVLPALDPSLDRLAKAESFICQATDGPGQGTLPDHQLDEFSVKLWKLKPKDIKGEMKARWEVFLIRLFPRLAPSRGQRRKSLIADPPVRRGEGARRYRYGGSDSDSESLWEFSDDELYAEPEPWR